MMMMTKIFFFSLVLLLLSNPYRSHRDHSYLSNSSLIHLSIFSSFSGLGRFLTLERRRKKKTGECSKRHQERRKREKYNDKFGYGSISMAIKNVNWPSLKRFIKYSLGYTKMEFMAANFPIVCGEKAIIPLWVCLRMFLFCYFV